MRCKETDCFNCKYDYCINVGNYKKHTKEQNKKYTERNRTLRSERYALGLCTSCGKRVPSKGYKMCDYCRSYFKRKKTKHDRENGFFQDAFWTAWTDVQNAAKINPLRDTSCAIDV